MSFENPSVDPEVKNKQELAEAVDKEMAQELEGRMDLDARRKIGPQARGYYGGALDAGLEDPTLGPKIEENTMAFLREKYGDAFSRVLSDAVDEDGFIVKKNGEKTTIKPSQLLDLTDEMKNVIEKSGWDSVYGWKPPKEPTHHEPPVFRDVDGNEFRVHDHFDDVFDNPAVFLERLHSDYKPVIDRFTELNTEKARIFASHPGWDNEEEKNKWYAENGEDLDGWRKEKDELYEEARNAFGYEAGYLIDNATMARIEKAAEADANADIHANEEILSNAERDTRKEDWSIPNTPHCFTQDEVPESVRLNVLGQVVMFPEESQRAEGIIKKCEGDMGRLLRMTGYDDKPITEKDKLYVSLLLRAQASLYNHFSRILWEDPRSEKTEKTPANYKDRALFLKEMLREIKETRAQFGKDMPSIAGRKYSSERSVLEKIASKDIGLTLPNTKIWQQYQGWDAQSAQKLLEELDRHNDSL